MSKTFELGIRINVDNRDMAVKMRLSEQDVKRFGAALGALQGHGARASQALAGMSRHLANIAHLAVASLGVEKLVGTLAQFDKLNASLKTVTGSLAAAGAAGEMLRRFSTETPYELSEVTEAFIRLQSLGLHPLDQFLDPHEISGRHGHGDVRALIVGAPFGNRLGTGTEAGDRHRPPGYAS